MKGLKEIGNGHYQVKSNEEDIPIEFLDDSDICDEYIEIETDDVIEDD